MQFLATLTGLALAVASVASVPTPASAMQAREWNNCFSRDYILGLIEQERIFEMHTDVAAAVAAGNAIFDPAFVEYGDSINSLRGAPLGTQVEFNASTYITETTSQPAIPQIDTLSTTIDCNQFVWQFRFYGIGTGPNPYIQGFTLGKVNDKGLIYYQYVEFNSLAWAENIGFTVAPPTTGPFAPSSS